MINMALYLCDFFLKNPSLIKRKTPESELRESLQNIWRVLLKTVKILKNKEYLRHTYLLEVHKEIMVIKWSMAAWMGN